MLTKIVFII